MKVLIAYDPQNTDGKHDGDEFKHQAENAAAYYCRDSEGKIINGNVRDLIVIKIEGKNATEKRYNLFEQMQEIAVKHRGSFDRVIFLCHGHPKALNRGMVKGQKIAEFCELLRDLTHPASGIVFYSCKTAESENGFAHQVCELTQCEVIGHKTSGHTVWNPYKRHFIPGQPMLNLYPAFGDDFRQHVADLKDSTVAFDFVEGALHA